MTSKKYNVLSWIPVVLIAILIFYFSSRTGSQSNAQSDPIVDYLARLFHMQSTTVLPLVKLVRKSGHFIEYTLFGFALVYALDKNLTKYQYVLSLIIGYAYAVLDEIHQVFVPERAGRFTDTLIDLAGIATGIFIYWIIRRQKNR